MHSNVDTVMNIIQFMLGTFLLAGAFLAVAYLIVHFFTLKRTRDEKIAQRKSMEADFKEFMYYVERPINVPDYPAEQMKLDPSKVIIESNRCSSPTCACNRPLTKEEKDDNQGTTRAAR